MIEYTQTPLQANGHKNLFFSRKIPYTHANTFSAFCSNSSAFIVVCNYVQNVSAMTSEVFCLVLRKKPYTDAETFSTFCSNSSAFDNRFGALFHILLYALHCITFTCAISRVQTHRMLRLKQINHRLMFHYLSFSSKQSNAKGVIRCKSKLFRRRGSLFSWGHKPIISFQKYNMRGFCCIKPYTRLL